LLYRTIGKSESETSNPGIVNDNSNDGVSESQKREQKENIMIRMYVDNNYDDDMREVMTTDSNNNDIG